MGVLDLGLGPYEFRLLWEFSSLCEGVTTLMTLFEEVFFISDRTGVEPAAQRQVGMGAECSVPCAANNKFTEQDAKVLRDAAVSSNPPVEGRAWYERKGRYTSTNMLFIARIALPDLLLLLYRKHSKIAGPCFCILLSHVSVASSQAASKLFRLLVCVGTYQLGKLIKITAT